MLKPGSRLAEIWGLTKVRLRIFTREPEAVFWVFVFPVVLALVLGFAFREGDPVASRLGVVGDVRLETEGIRVEIEKYENQNEAEKDLGRSRVDLVIVAGEPAELLFDQNRPEGQLARERALNAMGARDTSGDDAVATSSPLGSRGRRYIDFLFAGLIGMNVLGTSLWGVGFAVADMRQKKLLKRLVVTPMRKSSLLFSFFGFRLVFLVMEVGMILTFGVLVFGVPIEGSFFDFAFLAILGGLSFSGLGLLVASRAQTIEGVSGLMNFVLVPMWLGSGVFFSYERFPEFLHPFIQLLPLTALNDALRAVMFDGESLFAQGKELAVIVAWGVIPFAIALKIFRWR